MNLSLNTTFALAHYDGRRRHSKAMESQPDYSRTGEGQGQSSLSPEYMYVNLGLQGYQVSDDEINMDLVTFRAHYANSGGSVEYVLRFLV